MKHNYISVSILSGVIILVFICNCLFIANIYPKRDDQKIAFTLQKLDEINDKIIAREVVEDSYFYYLGNDKSLLDDTKNYNKSTGLLTANFTVIAFNVAEPMYQDMTNTANKYESYDRFKDYLNFPPEVREYQEIIAHACMYRNCADLLFANPKMSYFLGRGLGGSLAMWPSTIQNEGESFGKPLRADLAEYFDLVDGLIVKIQNYREMLVSQK